MYLTPADNLRWNAILEPVMSLSESRFSSTNSNLRCPIKTSLTEIDVKRLIMRF